MVRSVFEVLTNSCVGLAADGARLVPDTHEECTSRDELCPACQVFGFLGEENEGVHKGLVNLGEARLQGDVTLADRFHLPALYGPNIMIEENGTRRLNVEHYGSPQDPNGRKFYLHHRAFKDGFPHASQKRDYVKPLAEGSEFTFDVTFENCSPRHLAALVAALVLTDDAAAESGRTKVRHKLGYGKPVGLGSVQVKIDRAVLDPSPQDRYSTFNPDPEILTGDPLTDWVNAKQLQYFDDPTPPVRALADVLRYPPDPEVEVTYQADPPE